MNLQTALIPELLDASLPVILVIRSWASATSGLPGCYSSSFSWQTKIRALDMTTPAGSEGNSRFFGELQETLTDVL